jgi:hypothetical protein
MIQNGGEGQCADHSDQSVDAFGPNGEDVTIFNDFPFVVGTTRSSVATRRWADGVQGVH